MKIKQHIVIINLTFPPSWRKLAFMHLDLHVHSLLSPCSQLTIDEILAHAQGNGLDGVCITDHDTMAIRHHIKEGLQPNGLCIIFGMEYSTSDGDFLLFGPYEELTPGLPSQLLLRHVIITGGVAIAAHPFRKSRSTNEHLIRQNLCHIVEGVNGRNRAAENEPVMGWRNHYNVGMVGGSDAHCLTELGKVPTEFNRPVRDRTEFIQALKSGDYQQMVPRILPQKAA